VIPTSSRHLPHQATRRSLKGDGGVPAERAAIRRMGGAEGGRRSVGTRAWSMRAFFFVGFIYTMRHATHVVAQQQTADNPNLQCNPLANVVTTGSGTPPRTPNCLEHLQQRR
jgi:hypothetical protein